MEISTATFWLTKDGNSDDEYEDAAYPQDCVEALSCRSFRCAVADGATETSFAGLWAQLLVRGYADAVPLARSQKLWCDEIPTQNLAWYAEEKAQSGAFAALAGLTINADSSFVCEAFGDSCVMHVRDELILTAFPLASADEFNNRPALIGSVDRSISDIEFESYSGTWISGDHFFLLTDALARFLLQQPDQVKAFIELENQSDMRELAELHRNRIAADGRPFLPNDDLTFIRVIVR